MQNEKRLFRKFRLNNKYVTPRRASKGLGDMMKSPYPDVGSTVVIGQ